MSNENNETIGSSLTHKSYSGHYISRYLWLTSVSIQSVAQLLEYDVAIIIGLTPLIWLIKNYVLKSFFVYGNKNSIEARKFKKVTLAIFKEKIRSEWDIGKIKHTEPKLRLGADTLLTNRQREY